MTKALRWIYYWFHFHVFVLHILTLRATILFLGTVELTRLVSWKEFT